MARKLGMHYGITLLVFAALFCAVSDFVTPQAALAQSPTPVATSTPLPKSGVLSRSSTFGYNTKIVDGAWGGGDDTGGQGPITGSVSKKNDREWVARVFNNSEDTYNISAEVTQLNANGKRERSDSFSVTLGPRESNDRTLKATERTVDAELRLVRWKNLSEKKREAEAARNATPGATR